MENKLTELKLGEGVYTTTLTAKYLNRKKYETPNEKSICSHIPGTILDVIVKEGEKVKKGTPLLTFNAMKMINTLVAPFDGTIDTVFVKENQSVPKGGQLILFK